MNDSPGNKHQEIDILGLFPTPLYTSTGLFFEEDLVEMGLGRMLLDFPPPLREKVWQHAVTLTRIQPELGLRFLMRSREIVRLLDEKALNRWVLSLLDIYDAKGLHPALQCIFRLEETIEARTLGQGAITYEEVAGVLQHYLHGLGRRDLRLEKGEEPVHTDTQALYLPRSIGGLRDRRQHFLLYKITTTFLFYQVSLGSYKLAWSSMEAIARAIRDRYQTREEETVLSDLSRFFSLFPEPVLALDIYALLDTARIESRIRQDLPGLSREMAGIKKSLLERRPSVAGKSLKSLAMEERVRWWLAFSPGKPCLTDFRNAGILAALFQDRLCRVFEAQQSPEQLADMTADIYGTFETLPGTYEGVAPVPYAGKLHPEEAERARRRRRESNRAGFREELAKLVSELPECETVKIELPEKKKALARGDFIPPQELPDHLVIDGLPVPVPEGMKKLIEEIYEDLGSIPSSYLVVADEMSGHHFRPLCKVPEGTGYFLSSHAEDVHVLDEWDYRRQGYRRNWVLLREMEIVEEDPVFLEETLTCYRGMIQQIRRQFDRIRLEQKVLKRQQEGDGIDLDAVVEAFADWRAGHHPSERVFTHLRRDNRSVASVFLVDMSGSTSGWINEMERATLLIFCEALKVLGDECAIYGFSGQTRKRCELYRIKGFDECYDARVQKRIGGLKAREWTRMGPPIRHVSGLLGDVEARTKLLITLSDGKPDDYDAYKGDYAVEDTRHALIEARNMGIHSFCITIDKAEHRYLDHLYGRSNYIFINDLSLLPLKVPEIYKKLTT